MTQILNLLTTLLAFGFALGVIIVVHEAGHLLMAKAFGVRVLTFSVGFGKRLWGFQRGDTEYRVSAVPLGGYVRLSGEGLEEAPADGGEKPYDPREFINKPRWQRILVYLAGPAATIVLSLVLFAGLFMVGIEVLSFPDTPPLVSGVEAKSSADQAGLKRGDLIQAVNGDAVDNWQEVALILMGSPGKRVALTVQRDGKAFETAVTPKRIPRYEIGDFGGLIPSVRPQII